MPNCPYCSQELNLRLTAQFISEIDPTYYKAVNAFFEQMPGWVKWALRGALERIEKYPILAEAVVCAEWDRVLDINL